VSDGPGISLLVSDVDGTLVTSDKRLTQANIAAATRLAEAGVRLSLVSSRPPHGFAMLAGSLNLTAPIGAFNGGAILRPDLTIIEETHVAPDAAAIALQTFAEFGADAWVYTNELWYATHAEGRYVAKERRTVALEPTIVPSLKPYLDKVGKLVGSSEDYDRLADCEAALQKRLEGRAAAQRSQKYYLDVTPPGLDKGAATRRIAGMLDVPLSEVAVIGDMANDLPMFQVAAFKIAVGNGIDALKAQADFVSEDNEHDGFAAAVDRFVLPRAAARPSR
jgi:Cof subfamily protein (haloacid dehalogenase superfamily)